MTQTPTTKPAVTYSSFAVDVLMHGAAFACNHADQMGVTGAQLAKWLSRMTLKTRKYQPLTAQVTL